ncbi:hypothetical protein BH11BAC5_BH11BAC5_11400 [soil metagenome]
MKQTEFIFFKRYSISFLLQDVDVKFLNSLTVNNRCIKDFIV